MRSKQRSPRDIFFIKALLSFCSVALLGIGIFFLIFVNALPPEDTNITAKAEGIVVLTGTARERLEAGFDLISAGHGQRLLISGVYEQQSFSDIAALDQGRGFADCCLDLDYQARSTVENAEQTAKWVRVQNYTSLIVVTSAHHMPRAMLEFRRTMPHVRLIPYPIVPGGVKLDAWWRYPGTLALLGGEFVRYMFSLIGLSA